MRWVHVGSSSPGAGGMVVLGTLRDHCTLGRPVLLVVGALLAGVVLAGCRPLWRWPAVRLWLRYLAAFPILLGLAFLFRLCP